MKKLILFLLLMLVPTLAFAQWDRTGVRLSTDCSTTTGKGKLCYNTSTLKLYVGNGTTAVEVGGISTGTDCSSYTTDGAACWDTDDNKLYVGNGTSAQEIGGTASTIAVLDTNDSSSYVALFESATGNLAAKTDTSITYDATTGILTIVGVVATGTSSMTLGTAGSTVGQVIFKNGTSGSITVQPTTGALGTITITLPATTGTVPTGTATSAATWATPSTSGNVAKSDGTNWTSSGTLNIASMDMTSATSSIPWIVAVTCSNTADATSCWDSDDNDLVIGDGSTSIKLAFTANATYTFPTTTATLARTDAGQTFTGVNVFTAPTFTTSITPTAAGASTIGTTALEWGNLYLTDSAVIYGQADQSATLTSSASLWTANNLSVSTQFKLPSSDADPTGTAGYMRHDSTYTDASGGGGVKWHDGTNVRTVIDSGTTYTYVIKTEFLPVSYMEDGAAPPAVSSVLASTRKVRIRDFDGVSNENLEFHWVVPDDYVGGIKFRFIGYVSNATAPANTEVIAFSLAGCSNGNSDVLGCTAGTAQTSSLTADANYVQYDRVAGAYSSAITVTNITAGESAQFILIRLAESTDTYAQDFGLAGIEIKYQAKIMLNSTY